MAFEKLRTIVITAIPKPRSRERFRKIAETTPTPRKRVLRTRCLSPQKMRSAEQVRCSQSAARNPSITAHPGGLLRLRGIPRIRRGFHERIRVGFCIIEGH
jgi:hypothetical protein